MSSKLSANGLKRKASVIATYNEISLSTDTEKGTQMGGAHISSRARPDLCVLCTERHSPISCPKVNPVCQDTIEAMVNNPAIEQRCTCFQMQRLPSFSRNQLLESGNLLATSCCLTQETVA